MTTITRFMKSKVAQSLALTLAVSVPASADIIDFDLSGTTGYTAGGTTDFNSDSDDIAISVQNGYFSQFNDLYGSSQGNNQGWLYTTAGGQGEEFTYSSQVMQSIEYKNESGTDQRFNYDFYINQGGLNAYNYGFGDLAEYSRSGYIVTILLNGSAIFGSSAEINTTMSDETFDKSGTDLGGVYGGDYYSWSRYTDSLDLGVFAADETFTLSYSIFSYVAGNHSSDGCGEVPSFTDGGELREQESFFSEECEYGEGGPGFYNGSAYTQFGDPNSINATPIFSNQNISGSNVASSVPEPESLALAGIGLAGLAFRRRKQKIAK